MNGHELVKALRAAHECNEDCFLCKEELEQYTVKPYSRWSEFVNSDQALRIGLAVMEYKATFPKFSDDPVEQFLIEEAVLSNYFFKKAELETEQIERQSVEQQAKQELAEFMQNRLDTGT